MVHKVQKGVEIMDNLVSILDSFNPGWRERKYVAI
jgi:hypothetical protein